MLNGRKIVLGVTGGISAYKAIEVTRRLTDLGAHVTPVLTESAMNMVGKTTFTALASEPVKTSLWTDSDHIPHTRMGQTADLILVCPATARILSDLRIGRSADLLSATLLATAGPVMVCPAMHTEMWEHPATRENMSVLVDRGVMVVGPEQGRLAGGDMGVGRLAEPAKVVSAVVDFFVPNQTLAGRSVLITAGGTREAIDPVRYIGNRSSGKQGHALADAAVKMGADVTLVTTVGLPAPAGAKRIDVTTAAEMAEVVFSEAPSHDVIVMAAAVADFRPATVADTKIKKASGIPEIHLERTVDILAGLGKMKSEGQVLVGFAAETTNVADNAQGKLERKGADIIVANDVSKPGVGFAHDTNQVTIISVNASPVEVALADKSAIAAVVLEAAAAHFPQPESPQE